MHFVDLAGSQITVTARSCVRTPPAQGISRALHELATNARKNGALSTGACHVDTGWGTRGDAITMSWTEREEPPMSAPQRRGTVRSTLIMRLQA
jgi:two-component sensor histidine kinase